MQGFLRVFIRKKKSVRASGTDQECNQLREESKALELDSDSDDESESEKPVLGDSEEEDVTMTAYQLTPTTMRIASGTTKRWWTTVKILANATRRCWTMI
jgi:hypothetical protein